MQDKGELTAEQESIRNRVQELFTTQIHTLEPSTITPHLIKTYIKQLRKNCAPGMDLITAEHLDYGCSPVLCQMLASLYTIMFSHSIVPKSFTVGVIIPIIKKPTLDPNSANSYRPITLSSVLSKLAEKIIMPSPDLSPSQFGFRAGRGTSSACRLLNDIMCYFNYDKTNIYVCSLDAEKCFDSIWHDGLFYKLRDVLAPCHWIFLRRWYSKLSAIVKWNSRFSQPFEVTRGTRQGSLLSPTLFNVFINELLVSLNELECGVRIPGFKCNSFAYADDVTLLSSTSVGLQQLIDCCANYAKKWRFKYNPSKSQCMTTGNISCTFMLENDAIEEAKSVEILGCIFQKNGKCDEHIQKRLQKCRQSYYSLAEIGMGYPGLDSETKAHLWRTICSPSMMYGMDCMHLSQANWKQTESLQGTLIKKSCGLSKRSHHSDVLSALHISKLKPIVTHNILSLFNRTMKTSSPHKDLCCSLLGIFMSKNKLYPGTIVNYIVNEGYSPISCAFNSDNFLQKAFHQLNVCNYSSNDPIIDSLKYLLFHENYQKPYSMEYSLSKLLTKSF